MLAGIGADGAVTVEGHFVGRLDGVHFEPARGASALEDRALRAAAERAVGAGNRAPPRRTGGRGRRGLRA